MNPGGGPGSLDGQYAFGRFNPAAGLTFSPVHFLNLYASYAESSRAPTSIELGCADPNNPCNLPNALAGDPPLNQVVTRTFEAGVRSNRGEGRLSWSGGWFRASNYNDLLFVTSDITGNGYFKNFGRTLRQGAEVHLSERINRVTLGGNYTFLRATYESPETVDGSSNNTNDSALAGSPGMDGVIQIQPGDRIPLIPQHMLKAFAEAQFTRKLSADLDLMAVSSSFARGNENNQSQPDGIYYLGTGNFSRVRCGQPGRALSASKTCTVVRPAQQSPGPSLLYRRTAGAHGIHEPGDIHRATSPGRWREFPLVHATFYAPGAPFGVWGGMRFSF